MRRGPRTSFFHSAVNLNNRFFVAGENLLRLDRSTDRVIGASVKFPAK